MLSELEQNFSALEKKILIMAKKYQDLHEKMSELSSEHQ